MSGRLNRTVWGLVIAVLSVREPHTQVPTASARFSDPVPVTRQQVEFLSAEVVNLAARIADGEIQFKTMEIDRLYEKATALVLDRAATELMKTTIARDEFLKLSNNLQQRAAADSFFGQFILQYRQIPRSTQEQGAQAAYSQLRTQVFRLAENNLLAYRAIAAAKSFTFDLQVNSVPVGAVLSFRRTGDSYERNGDPTNTTLKNLIYAVWTVKAELPKQTPQEKEHNPWRESNHVLTFVF